MAAKRAARRGVKKVPVRQLSPEEIAARERQRHQGRADARFKAMHPQLDADERAIRKVHRDALRDWGHKANGTPETHAHAARVVQGALARLYERGAIDIDQLGSGQEIRATYEAITAGVAVRSASLEARVDASRNGDGAFYEALGRVRREVAYSAWRAALGAGREAGAVLMVIVQDVAITVAARGCGVPYRRARARLIDALDRWPGYHANARRDVDEVSLAAAQAAAVGDWR